MTNSPISQLIDALRAEVEAYGKLFRLLDRQRTALLNQNPDEILDVSETLNVQADEVKGLQALRVGLIERLSPNPGGARRGISSIMDQMDEPSRPLIEELIREINRLVKESDRLLRRNRMLYRRAWDIGQEMMRALNPQGDTFDIYARDGYTRGSRRAEAAGYVTRSA